MANRTCLKGTHYLQHVLAVGVQVVQDTGNFVSKKDASVFPSVATSETVTNILLADDLEGAGHVWQFLKDADGIMHPWVRCYVHLGEEYDHFISKLKEN